MDLKDMILVTENDRGTETNMLMTLDDYKPYLTDPSYGTKLEEDKKQIVKEVLKKHGLHEQIIGLPYGCDASKLAKWGIPVFVFGPGSIEQAHTKEEYIEINQIGKASEVLKDLVLKFTEKE